VARLAAEVRRMRANRRRKVIIISERVIIIITIIIMIISLCVLADFTEASCESEHQKEMTNKRFARLLRASLPLSLFLSLFLCFYSSLTFYPFLPERFILLFIVLLLPPAFSIYFDSRYTITVPPLSLSFSVFLSLSLCTLPLIRAINNSR